MRQNSQNLAAPPVSPVKEAAGPALRRFLKERAPAAARPLEKAALLELTTKMCLIQLFCQGLVRCCCGELYRNMIM